MYLIKKVYESKKENIEQDRPCVFFYDEIDKEKLVSFLDYAHCLDTDLSYEEVNYNLIEIFNKLGFCSADSIFLHDMKFGSSRYNNSIDGYCSFNYSVNSLEYNDVDMLSYYSSSELFNGNASIYPGVKLSSGDESLYYTVGTGPYIRKYAIKINDEVTLTREFLKDEVLFILDKEDSSFVMRIKKPNSKVVTNDYVLDNELELVEYLGGLTGPYDIVEIYNKLCEVCLGSDISVYPEITLCESSNTLSGWMDINLISIKNGNIDTFVKTVGDKTITCYGNGNWSYTMVDENIIFTINSGRTLRYGIETRNEKEMDDYTDSLLKYDVSTARCEIEDTKKLIRAKLRLDNKKRK